MPTGTIIIGTIGTQTAGVPFQIAGTYALSGGSFVEQLVYQNDAAGTAVPIAAPVINLQTATWTLNHLGLPAGTHTISVRDKLTGTTVVSNSFLVLGTPTISITSIASVTAGTTFTLSGTINNFATTPTLTYTIDGGTPQSVNTVTNGSPGSFSVSVVAPAAGTHTIIVSSGSVVSAPASFTTTPVARSIAFTLPSTLGPSQAFAFTGTITGYTSIPSLTYSIDGGTPITITGVTLAGWSMTITAPSVVGNHTIVVTDGTVSTPVAFVVTAAPTIAPSQPIGVVAGTAFTFTGFLSGYTSIPSLSYKLDGGASVTMTGVSVTGWSMSVTIGTAGSHTLVVSDGIGTTGSTTFTVSPASAVVVTWNPADKAAIITLSNSNKTATATGSSTPYAVQQAVRSTAAVPPTSLVVVCEINLATLTQNWSAGVADATFSLTASNGAGSDTHSIGFYPSTGAGSQPAQTVFFNNNQLTTGNGVSSSNGDILTIALNGMNAFFSTPSMRTTSGVNWNNLTTADPIANIGGFPFTGIGSPYFVVFSESEGTGVAILNDGSSAFSTFLTDYQAVHPGATVALGTQAGPPPPPTKTITPNTPVGVISGTPFTFTGAINGYTPNAPNLTYSIDGGAPTLLAGVTTTGWSTTITVTGVGNHTITVSDGSGTSGATASFQAISVASPPPTGGPGPAVSGSFVNVDFTSQTGKTIVRELFGVSTATMLDFNFQICGTPGFQTASLALNPPLLRFNSNSGATGGYTSLNMFPNGPRGTPNFNVCAPLVANLWKIVNLSTTKIIMGFGGGTDAQGDFLGWSVSDFAFAMAQFVAHLRTTPGGNGVPIDPLYWEVSNEPNVGSGTYNSYFNACADAIHAIDAKYIVSGPVSANDFGYVSGLISGSNSTRVGLLNSHFYLYCPGSDPIPTNQDCCQGLPGINPATGLRQGTSGTTFGGEITSNTNGTYMAGKPFFAGEYNIGCGPPDTNNREQTIIGACYAASTLMQLVDTSNVPVWGGIWEYGPAGNWGVFQPNGAEYTAASYSVDPQGYLISKGAAVMPGAVANSSAPTGGVNVIATANGTGFAVMMVNYTTGAKTGSLALSHWPVNTTGTGTVNVWTLSQAALQGSTTTVAVTAGATANITIPGQSVVIVYLA